MQLVDVSVKRPIFAAMLIMALVVFGLFAYPRLGVDLYPAVDFPVVTATVNTANADSGVQDGAVDLSAFAGANVRITFRFTVPEGQTGPGFVELDNVRLSPGEPAIP